MDDGAPEPDPDAVGPAIYAWYALHDGLRADPGEIIAWAAATVAGQLEAVGPDIVNPLPHGRASVAIDDAALILRMVAALFDRRIRPISGEPPLAFKAELKRPQRHRPTKNPVGIESLAWWGHAKEVEELIGSGRPQKTAVGVVAQRLGISARTVADWVRDRRKALAKADELRIAKLAGGDASKSPT